MNGDGSECVPCPALIDGTSATFLKPIDQEPTAQFVITLAPEPPPTRRASRSTTGRTARAGPREVRRRFTAAWRKRQRDDLALIVADTVPLTAKPLIDYDVLTATADASDAGLPARLRLRADHAGARRRLDADHHYLY
jgi:hypothetical protein